MLLDIGLPRLDGYEVCRRIRAQAWGQDLLLIALTGWGQEEDRQGIEGCWFRRAPRQAVDDEVLLKLLASLPSNTRQLTRRRPSVLARTSNIWNTTCQTLSPSSRVRRPFWMRCSDISRMRGRTNTKAGPPGAHSRWLIIIHAERVDWMPRLKLILGSWEAQEFQPFERMGHVREVQGRSLGDLLDEFTCPF